MNTGIYPYNKKVAMQAMGIKEMQPIDSSGISSIHIDLVANDSKVLANVSYNHYGIVVTGIQLRQGARGVYIKYPDLLRVDGTRQSYFFPANSAVTRIIEKAIHQEFELKKRELVEKLDWKLTQRKNSA